MKKNDKYSAARPGRAPARDVRDAQTEPLQSPAMPSFRLVRSRRRTIALVVTLAGELEVRAPLRASNGDILRMIERHGRWIHRKQIEQRLRAPLELRFEEGALIAIDGVARQISFSGKSRLARLDGTSLILSQSLRGREDACRSAIVVLLRKLTLERMDQFTLSVAQRCGLTVKSVRVTSAQRRWGSCSSRGSLNFTYRLAQAPIFVQEYLAVHEVAHLRHPNHSKDYWGFVEQLMPDFRRAEQWLREEGRRLPL